jgi:O-antigen/teichoic acid export membrane protein
MKIYRVLRTMSAHGYGQVVTILSALIIPSVTVARWGAEGFGYWVTLTALAQFFLMADLGAAAALSNQLCLKFARTQDNAWTLTRSVLRNYLAKATVAAGIIIIIALFVWYYYERRLATEQSVKLSITFVLLALSSTMQPVISVYCAVWRFIGENAVGIFISNTVRLIEFMVIVVCVLLRKESIIVAAAIFVLKVISVIVASFHASILLKGNSSLSQYRDDAHAEFHSLKQAGHGFALISLSQQMALHVPTLLISAILGPVFAGVFAASRTISRLPVQPLTVVLTSLNPELTELIAKEQYERLRLIVRRVAVLAIVSAVIVGIGAVLYMDVLERVWLRGRMSLNLSVLVVLCLAAVFYIGGQVLNLALTSANHTRDQSRQFLVVTVLTMAAMPPVLFFTQSILWGVLLLLMSESLMVVLLARRYNLLVYDKI